MHFQISYKYNYLSPDSISLLSGFDYSSIEMTDRYYHMTSEQGELYRHSVISNTIPFVFAEAQ